MDFKRVKHFLGLPGKEAARDTTPAYVISQGLPAPETVPRSAPDLDRVAAELTEMSSLALAGAGVHQRNRSAERRLAGHRDDSALISRVIVEKRADKVRREAQDRKNPLGRAA